MTHWIKVATANNGMFNIFHWGSVRASERASTRVHRAPTLTKVAPAVLTPSRSDWANFIPGPYGFQTPEYPQFFYIRALEITTKFATRLGFAADAAYFGGLATAARALYQKTYFVPATNCYAGCTLVPLD